MGTQFLFEAAIIAASIVASVLFVAWIQFYLNYSMKHYGNGHMNRS